jgi:hypothetical protein
MSATRPYPSKLVWLALLGLLILFTCYALPQYFKAMESGLWPQAKGVITISHLKVGYFKQMKGYYGVIEYDYCVGKTRFHGTRLSFNRVHLAVEDAWKPVVDSYPVGKQVTVYYDPKNPGLAVLEPGLHGEMHDMFILALIYIGFFVAAFLWALVATWADHSRGIVSAR